MEEGDVEEVADDGVGLLAFLETDGHAVSVEVFELVEEGLEEVEVVVEDQQSELVAARLLDEAAQLYVVEHVHTSKYADKTNLTHHSRVIP